MTQPSGEPPEEPFPTWKYIWVFGCALIGGCAGVWIGLQIHPIVAYLGFMLGTAGGAAWAMNPTL